MAGPDLDKRSNTREAPVWRHTFDDIEFTDGGGYAAQTTSAININGYITQLVAVITTGGGDPDVTFSILEGTTTVYESSATDDGQTAVLTPNRYVAGSITLSVVLDKDAGTNGVTITMTLYGT